jgi:hypothetical protein
MGVKVTNNAFGTLSASINTTDTTITLDSGQGARFPTLGASDYFYGTVIDTSNNLEIVKVTARSTDSMTVTRAQDNTTALSFAIGDRFELRPTAALFEDISDSAQVVSDTTPQLGGDLASNGSDILMADSDKVVLGTGADMEIFHDGSDSYIKDVGTGNLLIQGNGTAVIIEDTAGNNNVVAYPNGATTLSHGGSAKLATTSTGVTVTGSLQTQDLVLNNLSKNSPNSVDGTRGHWRVQEGSDNLYLINETTGKKYKFKIEEVE